jgi:hypothetical protein
MISCLISSHECHNVNTDMFLHAISKTSGRNMFEFCIVDVNCKLSDMSALLKTKIEHYDVFHEVFIVSICSAF